MFGLFLLVRLTVEIPVAVICDRDKPKVELSSTAIGGDFEKHRILPCVTYTHKSRSMQAGTQTSADRNGFLWACGRKVLTEDRDFARECGKIAVSTGRPLQAAPRAAAQAAGSSGD